MTENETANDFLKPIENEEELDKELDKYDID